MRCFIIQRTELAAVFICGFISFFCVYAAAYRSREHAKEMVCAANLRINSQSVLGYAADHDGLVTFNTAGPWPCDISFSATDDLMEYGAIRQGFYCPSNKIANPFDKRFWQYAMLSGFQPPDCYTDFDESMLSPTQKKMYFRIISYFFLTDLDPPTWTRGSFLGSPPRAWIRDLDDIANPQEYELIVDQTMSQTPSSVFYGFTGDGLWVIGQISEQSNHLDKSGMPLGGNIGFVDGHVAWRPFAQMQMRLKMGLYNWW